MGTGMPCSDNKNTGLGMYTVHMYNVHCEWAEILFWKSAFSKINRAQRLKKHEELTLNKILGHLQNISVNGLRVNFIFDWFILLIFVLHVITDWASNASHFGN